MKREITIHLTPLLAIFIFTSTIWLANRVPASNHILLFLGLLIGSFALDIDHLVYWFFTNPQSYESQLASVAIQKRDFRAILKLLESTHKKHTNLIFHHFFFQIVLTLTSLFVFSISNSPFILGLLLAINIHLMVDEINDFFQDRGHLQNWLFARESKQLPISLLGHYLILFSIFQIFLLLTLILSKI